MLNGVECKGDGATRQGRNRRDALTAQKTVDKRFREGHHDAQGGERAHYPRVARGWRGGWGFSNVTVGIQGTSCPLVGWGRHSKCLGARGAGHVGGVTDKV